MIHRNGFCHAWLLSLLSFRQLDLTASVAFYKTWSYSREQLSQLLVECFCGLILWGLLVLLDIVLPWLRC